MSLFLFALISISKTLVSAAHMSLLLSDRTLLASQSLCLAFKRSCWRATRTAAVSLRARYPQFIWLKRLAPLLGASRRCSCCTKPAQGRAEPALTVRTPLFQAAAPPAPPLSTRLCWRRNFLGVRAAFVGCERAGVGLVGALVGCAADVL